MASFDKSTIVRFKNGLTRAFFRYGEYVVPGRAGTIACDLWFTAPPRMGELPVPDGGEAFSVEAQGFEVKGVVWGAPEDSTEEAKVVYLLHGWGGRGSQFGAMVEPLVAAGYRVVMFDAPSHGDSERGPAGPRRTNGIEFAKALDAVAARFGPADTVIAHSLGTIATYLTLRFGWLGARRLVFVAPMVEAASLFDQFQTILGFGPRTRRAFDRAVDDFVGIRVADFDARVQARYCEPLPTLVVADRSDRQTPYDDAADFARSIDSTLVTTEGLGHRRILRDPAVIAQIVDFLAPPEELEVTA